MAKIKGRIIDKNRYAKKYSLRRAAPRLTYQGDSDLSIELGTIRFENEEQKLFVFEAPFTNDNYTVIAMPRDLNDSNMADTERGSANVSLYIDNTSFSRDSVIIKASMAYSGYADIIAIKVGQ